MKCCCVTAGCPGAAPEAVSCSLTRAVVMQQARPGPGIRWAVAACSLFQRSRAKTLLSARRCTTAASVTHVAMTADYHSKVLPRSAPHTKTAFHKSTFGAVAVTAGIAVPRTSDSCRLDSLEAWSSSAAEQEDVAQQRQECSPRRALQWEFSTSRPNQKLQRSW